MKSVISKSCFAAVTVTAMLNPGTNALFDPSQTAKTKIAMALQEEADADRILKEQRTLEGKGHSTLEEDFGLSGGQGTKTKSKKKSKKKKVSPEIKSVNVTSANVDMSSLDKGTLSQTTDFVSLWKMPTWAEDVKAFGPCLEEYEDHVRNGVGCPEFQTTGVAEFFAKKQYDGFVLLSLGYAPRMARVGLIFEGCGASAITDLISPLVRYNMQDAKKQLGYHCAPPDSDCKRSLVQTTAIDHQIGLRRDCPMLILGMVADTTDVDPDHLSAMRGQATTISRAYKSNEENGDGAYFKGSSRDFGAAVAICFYVRYNGLGVTETQPVSAQAMAQSMYDVPTEAGAGIPSLTSLEESPVVGVVKGVVLAPGKGAAWVAKNAGKAFMGGIGLATGVGNGKGIVGR